MHLAAIQLQDLLVVVVFIVVPVVQKIFQHLQKTRAEAEAKERMRHRREGTLPTSTATSTTDEPRVRGGLLERLEELVGEAQPETGRAERRTRVPEFEAETTWGAVVPEFAVDPEPEEAPRRVAPAAEVRKPIAQISDFESTSREGLGAMSAAPREDDAEAGRLDYTALTEIVGLGDDDDPLRPLVDLSEVAALPTSPGGAAARPRGARRGGRAVGFTGEQNWRRAVVLAEVLGAPVSMRDPGGFAPGLAPWHS